MVFDSLRRVITEFRAAMCDRQKDPYQATLYECRHCGTKVSAGTEQCPVCDAEEIAAYNL